MEVCNLSHLTDSEDIRKAYLDRESFYIKCALDNFRDKLLNILETAGSNLGYTHTLESKLKMSERGT